MSQARAKIEANLAKIKKLTEENVALEALAATEIDTSKVVAGTKVEFSYGKPAQVFIGVVKGIKVPPEGVKGPKLVRIEKGEGADADIVSVFPSQISKVFDAEGVEQA